MPNQQIGSAPAVVSEKSYRVSIGMPVFNGAEKIQRALNSLLEQKFEDYEIVISDNGSTDSTKTLIDLYANKCARIRVIYQSENVGALANFRRVLDEAKGEFFFWAAHDDWWSPDFVASAVRTLELNPEAAGCMGTVQYVDHEGKVFATSEPPYGLENPDVFQRVRNYLLNGTTDNLIYGVFRRHVLLNAAFVPSTCPEKCIIMHAVISGPIVDAEGMEYFNEYSFKTAGEVADALKIEGYSFKYEVPVFKQIIKDLRARFGLMEFLQLFAIFVLRNNWHKAYAKNALRKFGIPV